MNTTDKYYYGTPSLKKEAEGHGIRKLLRIHATYKKGLITADECFSAMYKVSDALKALYDIHGYSFIIAMLKTEAELLPFPDNKKYTLNERQWIELLNRQLETVESVVIK